MIEKLYSPKTYPCPMPEEIEQMGSIAVSIANRWLLGWPKQAKTLIQSGNYLDCLAGQVDQEKTMLANEANLRHLTRREILQMYEIKESPPAG